MKGNIITNVLAALILLTLFYFINKDMENGSTLTDALSSVSGWVTTSIMLLLGKDEYLTNLIKKDSEK